VLEAGDCAQTTEVSPSAIAARAIAFKAVEVVLMPRLLRKRGQQGGLAGSLHYLDATTIPFGNQVRE
jgi:hypothetical protein